MLELTVLFKTLWTFMRPILAAKANRILIQEGLPLAESIVSTLQNTYLSPAQKREKAIKDLKESLNDAKVIITSDSMLNMIVEMAYNKYRASNQA